jgi:3-isopropylmalate/(R)-2-methylmalate dehydratase small subunit
LLPIVCDTSRIYEGNRLVIHAADAKGSGIAVRNVTTGEDISSAALPKIMLDIFAAGGLVPYFREHGDFQL